MRSSKTKARSTHAVSGQSDENNTHTAASEKKPWRALFHFTSRKDLPLLIAAIACSVSSSVASPAQAFIIGKIFDLLIQSSAGSITGEDFLQKESRWALYLVIIACGSWVLHFLEYTFWITFGEHQAREARLRLHHALSRKDISWFDIHGDVAALSRYLTQIQELQLAVSQPFGTLLSLVTTAVLAVAQAFYNSWSLTVVTLAGAPVVAFVVIYFGSGMQKGIDDQNIALTDARSRSTIAISSIETVKCFIAEQFELDRYEECIQRAANHYYSVVNKNAIQMACLTFLIQAMFVQAFYYGGILIHQGNRTASQVVTTFFSAISAFQAVQGILPQLIVLEKGRAAGHDLAQLLTEDKSSAKQTGRIRPLACNGDIRFHDVSFCYPGTSQPVLDHVDFLIPGNEMTFIIGQSGSGKSTIGQLLVQFYSEYDGLITLDGLDLKALEAHWLRSRLFLVEQTSTLFDLTISQNIALGRPLVAASEGEIGAAAEFALLQLMISDLPSGLRTNLAASGSTVSGGQRQRIALARARLRDAPVLILDEATSALDQVNRSLMMDAIREWRQNKTTIVITHDLTQVKADDYAFVLDRGIVVQHGYRKHIELLENAPFHKLLSSNGQTRVSSLPALDASHADDNLRQKDLLSSLRVSPTKYEVMMDFSGGPSLPGLPMWLSRRTSIVPGSFALKAHRMSKPMLPPRISPGQHSEDLAARQASLESKVMQDFVTREADIAAQKRQRSGRVDYATRTSQQVRLDHDKDLTDKNKATNEITTHSIWQTIVVLWHDSSRFMRILILLGLWSATIHAVCSPIFAFVLSKLLGLYAMTSNTSHQALGYSLAILGIAVADALHTYGYRYFFERASQLWIDLLRLRAMHCILSQPMSFFEAEDNTTTTITRILDRDAEEMRNLVGRILGMILIAVVMLFISIVWALAVQWKMTLVALSVAPYILLVTSLYSRFTEKWEGLSNAAVSRTNAVFLESFANVRTVRVLTAESRFAKLFDLALQETYTTGRRRALVTGFLYGMSSSAATYSTAMVFYVGSRLVHDGADVMAILQVFTILIFTISNVTAILDYVPQLGIAKDTAWKVLDLARSLGTSHECGGSTRIPTVGDVDLHELRFAYPSRPDQVVLSNVNLTIKMNRITAIVGGSGSGKSTIAKLILRLHEAGLRDRQPSSSMLTVNGRSIEQISVRSLRSVAAVVPQNSPMFPATVAENITYGLEKESAYGSLGNIIKASKLAGIHDLVCSLPQGYATMVGPGGRGLSGGQAQRVAIARALVRQPSFLILDEATSALDPESAQLIRQTIVNLKHTKDVTMTILIITHSRDMMELADHVVVLDQGLLAEQGSFDELMSVPGHLHNLLHSGVVVV